MNDSWRCFFRPGDLVCSKHSILQVYPIPYLQWLSLKRTNTHVRVSPASVFLVVAVETYTTLGEDGHEEGSQNVMIVGHGIKLGWVRPSAIENVRCRDEPF